MADDNAWEYQQHPPPPPPPPGYRGGAQSSAPGVMVSVAEVLFQNPITRPLFYETRDRLVEYSEMT